MMRFFSSLLAVLLCILLTATALAEREPWDCPSCGRKGNTRNFCGKCGERAPESGSESADQVSSPVLTPESSPTPAPTPTPEPIRTFELSPEFVAEKGSVTVSWTDSAGHSPYRVRYQLQTPDGVNQPVQWANTEESESETSSTSFTLTQLLPGRTYKIEVLDKDSKPISRIYTLPDAAKFEDGLLTASSIKVSAQTRYKNASDYPSQSKITALRASDIISNLGSREYGFRYQIRYPTLSHTRTYLTQVAVVAPNGFTALTLAEEKKYGREYIGYVWYLMGPQVFSAIYESCGTVPTGTWNIELYWDGMLVNSTTFDVK